MNKQGYKGIGSYVLLVVVVAVLAWVCMQNWNMNAARDYTMAEFRSALTAGNVTSVDIEQNREIPTGTLTIRLKDSTVKELFVTDVNEVQELFVQEGFYNYFVHDMPQESWLLNLLPLLIVLASMFILFIILSNQAAAATEC